MSDDGAIDMTESLLQGLLSPQSPAPQPAPASPPAAPVQTAQSVTAASQAMPGTQPPVGGGSGAGGGKGGPQVATMPSVVARSKVVGQQPSASDVTLDLTKEASFEDNLGKLIAKDLSLAQHDRALAVALLQVHLDRAEVLDGMALSMPVAQVIGDNTGATLKALELAMKAGERLHKTAELLVNAQKNADSAALAALKMKMLKDGDGAGWGPEVPGG